MALLRPAGMRARSNAASAAGTRGSTSPSGRVRRFPVNLTGRDYLVGDLHGCYDQVIEGLRRVGFDTTKDRLFSLGDTVDRGPESHRALGFLSQPWVFATRGNHEDMFIELYESGEPHEAAVEFMTSHNGMGWWRDFPEALRGALLERFRAMPLVIEIETPRGTVGLVHAEVPSGMDWTAFVDRIEAGDKETVHAALWGRRRLGCEDESGVKGIGRIFVGHTPVHAPRRLGNVFYVDTGAVFGVLAGAPEDGRLTFSEVAAGTRVFHRNPPSEALDMRVSEEVETGPFGAYAG